MFSSIAKFVPVSLILLASMAVAQNQGANSKSQGPPMGGGTSSGGSGSSAKGTSGGGSSTGTSGSSSKGPSGGGSGMTPMGGGAKKPAPGSLEDLMDQALRHNPDILAATAKVREAESQLNQVRHQVVAKVVRLRTDIDLAKKMLDYCERTLQRAQANVKVGAASREDLEIATNEVEKKRAELAKLESELQSVTGSFKTYGIFWSAAFSPDGAQLFTGGTDGTVRVWDSHTGQLMSGNASGSGGFTNLTTTTSIVQAPMAERIRTALNKVVNLKEDVSLPLPEALDYFNEKAAINVPIRTVGKVEDISVSWIKGDLPVGAWLQMMEDSAPNLRFVVREYGILVTTKDRVPEGALTVLEFWKRSDRAKTRTNDPKAPPAK